MNRGVIQATAEQNGSIIPSIDGLIAATGTAKNMTVVRRNDTGYGAERGVIVQSMGVKVLSVEFVESREAQALGDS